MKDRLNPIDRLGDDGVQGHEAINGGNRGDLVVCTVGILKLITELKTLRVGLFHTTRFKLNTTLHQLR